MTRVKIWRVSQITAYLRQLIDSDILLQSFFAEGEVSNVKRYPSGHLYFTLKDEKAAMNCVMFRNYAESLAFDLADGAKVVVCGSVSIYEKTGQIQFYAEFLELAGKGRLYAVLEQLTERLRAEGLFDAARKRPIPFYPARVALITSGAGAAVQDMIQIIRRRNPAVRVTLYPVAVQGENAPAAITAGLAAVNAWGKADVILLGRGGGSAEDLWAFNAEIVARAVAGSKIPVISAVGHETDVTLADFAADLRAPTPSAAAELAVPERHVLMERRDVLLDQLTDAFLNRIGDARESFNALIRRPVLSEPLTAVDEKRRQAAGFCQTMCRLAAFQLATAREEHKNGCRALVHMSPLNVLARGYALVRDSSGAVISDADTLTVDGQITVQFRDGTAAARIIEKRVAKIHGKEEANI